EAGAARVRRDHHVREDRAAALGVELADDAAVDPAVRPAAVGGERDHPLVRRPRRAPGLLGPDGEGLDLVRERGDVELVVEAGEERRVGGIANGEACGHGAPSSDRSASSARTFAMKRGPGSGLRLRYVGSRSTNHDVPSSARTSWWPTSRSIVGKRATRSRTSAALASTCAAVSGYLSSSPTFSTPIATWFT